MYIVTVISVVIISVVRCLVFSSVDFLFIFWTVLVAGVCGRIRKPVRPTVLRQTGPV